MIYDLIIVVPTKGRKFLQFKIVIIETIKKSFFNNKFDKLLRIIQIRKVDSH